MAKKKSIDVRRAPFTGWEQGRCVIGDCREDAAYITEVNVGGSEVVTRLCESHGAELCSKLYSAVELGKPSEN